MVPGPEDEPTPETEQPSDEAETTQPDPQPDDEQSSGDDTAA